MYDIENIVNQSSIRSDTLHISYAVSFEQIATVIDIPVKQLESLNPCYKRNYIPQLSKPCLLVLPENMIHTYLQAEKQILNVQVDSESYTSLLANAGDVSNRTRVYHTVQAGEYYHKIAMHYNCTIENIKAWNGLTSMFLHPAQVLEIWINE